MRKFLNVLVVLVMLLGLSLVTAAPAGADDLQDVTATPDDNVVGATAIYTIAFTANVTDNISAVYMAFPAGFDVSEAIAGDVTGLGDGEISVDSQNVIYTVIEPVEIESETDITIELNNIINPEIPGIAYNVEVTTYNNNSTPAIIDGPNSSDNFEIVHGNLAAYLVEPAAGTKITGTAFDVEITAVDQFENVIEDEDTTLEGYEFTFSGPSIAPDGTEAEYPDMPANFSSGVWTASVTLNSVEADIVLMVEDDQTTPSSGISTVFDVDGINLDAVAYHTGEMVSVTVGYQDGNTNPATAQTTQVKVKSSTTDPDEVTIAMHETGVNTGLFSGTFTLVNTSPGAGQLLVDNGDTITVIFYPPATDYESTALVDETLPTITIVSPINDANLNEAKPAIEATLTDTGSGIDEDTAVMEIDGVVVDAVYAAGSFTYTASSNMTDREHSVTVNVSDLAGNTAAEVEWSFTVDTIAPTITSLSTVDGAYTSDNATNITAVLSDATSGIKAFTSDNITVTQGGAIGFTYSYNGATGLLTINPNADLVDGTVTVTIDVDDNAGNHAVQAAWTFTVDTDNIEITITSPADGSGTNVASAEVSGTYTETNFDEIILSINNAEVDVAVGAGTWTTTDNVTLEEGENEIVVTIYDLAGNSAEDTATITLDTLAPVVSNPATNPAIVQPESDTDVVFSANVTDGTGVGVDSVTIDLTPLSGGATVAMTEDDGSWSYIWTNENPAAGDYDLYVTVTDIVGNTDSSTAIVFRVVADTTHPVITEPAIEYPFALSSARPGDTVTISANVTDDILLGSVNASCDAFTGIANLFDNGVAPDETATDNIYTGTTTITGATAEDSYSITITATDAAGNDATDVTLDCNVNATLTGFNIELSRGWNLISAPLIPTDTDIDIVLANITDNVSQVRTWMYENGLLVEKVWSSSGPSDLAEFVDGQGYWVEMTIDKILSVTGTELPAPPQTPPVYNLHAGWNLIGFKSLANMDADDYLGVTVTGTVIRIFTFNPVTHYYVTILVNTDEFIPGRGYWIAISDDGTVYPGL